MKNSAFTLKKMKKYKKKKILLPNKKYLKNTMIVIICREISVF